MLSSKCFSNSLSISKLSSMKGKKYTESAKPLVMLSVFAFLICISVSQDSSECQNFISEEYLVTEKTFCRFSFQSCEEQDGRQSTVGEQLQRCIKYECSDSTSNRDSCDDRSASSIASVCHELCCPGQTSQNSSSPYSVRFCSGQYNQRAASSDVEEQNSRGYIFVIVVFSTMFLLFVIVCCCKKRNERLMAQYGQENGGVIVNVAPTTSVDLKEYDVDLEGPYFINSENTCAICLDSNVNLRTHCNHFFHGTCLYGWLKKKPNNPCPLCMGLTYNPVKVYCHACKAGDTLINIDSLTPSQEIEKYDDYKCSNCNKTGDDAISFILSEEESPQKENREEPALEKFSKSFAEQRSKELTFNQEQSVHSTPRRKRKTHRIRSMRQQQEHEINQSAKKMNTENELNECPEGNNI